MKAMIIALAGIAAVTTAFSAGGGAPPDEIATLAALNTELTGLWDWDAISKEPLDVEIVSSVNRDGYKIEGIYLNGVGGAAGKDRIFFYYAHPEKPQGKIPVVIDLTAGSKDDGRCLYLAKGLKAACVDLEWRCANASLKSKWAGGRPNYRVNGPLKTDEAYRVVSGARRVLDYLARQDYVDRKRLASMGGSMGGIYTLLLAGVDSRISAGLADVAVGHLANSDCLQGGFYLSPERKAIWLKAFDAYSHANAIKAKIIAVSSSSDHFCALGDLVETYKAIQSEKRLCIDANFDHSTPGFGGKPAFSGLWKWLPYCFGQQETYLSIPENLEIERNTCWVSTGREEVKEAFLYWSPGGKDVIWQARYWAEVKAELKGGECRAEIPARYAGLPMYVFMDVYNSKGQKVSTMPAFREGSASDRSAALWDDGQLWDVKSGLAAWRPVVSASPSIPRKANIQVAPPCGISVGPAAGEASNKFIVVTSSIGLAAAAAPKHAGLCFEVDGNGAAGELRLALARNFNSAFKEEEFAYALNYGKGVQKYSIPWKSFANLKSPTASLFPFDTLRIDGVRANGSQITIKSIAFADR